MHRTDLFADGSPLPKEVENELTILTEKRDIDIAHQVAFLENGLSIYRNEEKLCQEYGISLEYLARAKERLRGEIDRYKEDHKLGKYRIVQEVQGRVHLMTAIREAALRGDTESVERFGKVLDLLEKYAPDRKLNALLGILKDVDMNPVAPAAGPNNININVSSTSRAEELLAERRKKAIDIPK